MSAKPLVRFLSDESGPTTAEYALLLAFLLMACIVAIGALGSTNSSLWDTNASHINTALGS